VKTLGSGGDYSLLRSSCPSQGVAAAASDLTTARCKEKGAFEGLLGPAETQVLVFIIRMNQGEMLKLCVPQFLAL
jgi:hypothetical protein